MTLGILTAAVAILSLVISIIALQRSSTDSRLAREMAHRDAALDRLVAGPIPNISVVLGPWNSDGRVMRIVVQNSGRTAVTMSGGGLAFKLQDGGRRQIAIAYGHDERLDPEGAPRGYLLTAPVLRNVLDEAAEGSDIYPFVILGTNTIYGTPIYRGLIGMVMETAPPAPDQTYSVIDAYHDYRRERELVADSDGEGYEVTAGIFHKLYKVVSKD